MPVLLLLVLAHCEGPVHMHHMGGGGAVSRHVRLLTTPGATVLSIRISEQNVIKGLLGPRFVLYKVSMLIAPGGVLPCFSSEPSLLMDVKQV